LCCWGIGKQGFSRPLRGLEGVCGRPTYPHHPLEGGILLLGQFSFETFEFLFANHVVTIPIGFDHMKSSNDDPSVRQLRLHRLDVPIMQSVHTVLIVLFNRWGSGVKNASTVACLRSAKTPKTCTPCAVGVVIIATKCRCPRCNEISSIPITSMRSNSSQFTSVSIHRSNIPMTQASLTSNLRLTSLTVESI
jgi:hypothetical protein